MKKFKKLFAVVFALILTLSLALPVSADSIGTPTQLGSITVTGAIEGHEYRVYKMFDLISFDKVNNHYSYKLDLSTDVDGNYVDPWAEFFITGSGATFIAVDADGYISPKTTTGTATYEQFALDAITYAKSKGIAPTVPAKTATLSTELVFDELPPGYYLLDSSVGALCSIGTTDWDVQIKEKSSVTTQDKEVLENSTQLWGSENDIYIGGRVDFRTTITKQNGAQNLVLHDTMDASLDFDPTSVVVTLGTSKATVPATSYTLTYKCLDGCTYEATSNTPDVCTVCGFSDGCTFEIAFLNSWVRDLAVDTKIIVSYSAILNEKAVVDVPSLNTSYLAYGDGHRTVDDTTTTDTHDLKILKYTTDVAGAEVPLAGATFAIYDQAGKDGKVAIPFVKIADTSMTIGTGADAQIVSVPTYQVATTEQQNDASLTIYKSFTTDDTGRIRLVGLDSHEFYLEELAAPPAYNKLTDLVKIDIDKNGTVTVDNIPSAGDVAKIFNNTGVVLPTTGGTGTTVLYIAGAILTIGAAVLLITKRRMVNE